MSIHATNTTEGIFQVLDSVAVVPPGSTAQSFEEEGLTQIAINTQTLTITFFTEKASALYEFEVLEVQNTVDANPFVLTPEITDYTTTGFTVVFNGVPDTGSYYLRWLVKIV